MKKEIKKAMKNAFLPALIMAFIPYFYFEINYYLHCLVDMIKQLIIL